VEGGVAPEPVIGPLKRYAEVLDVPESWPVFTTLHRPSLASHVSDGLGDAGLGDDAIERVRAGAPDLIVAAEHDLDAPKPLTTDGARSIMERLGSDPHDVLAERRDELDLSLNGDYLELHGGRRGVGEVLFDSSERRCGPISGQQRRTGARGLPTYRGRRARRHGEGVLADGQS